MTDPTPKNIPTVPDNKVTISVPFELYSDIAMLGGKDGAWLNPEQANRFIEVIAVEAIEDAILILEQIAAQEKTITASKS